jgi:hypothetical protein
MSENFKMRLRGVAALAIAALFGWRGIWQPLQDAKAHEPEVQLSSMPLALTPALTFLGLFFLIGGDRWAFRNSKNGRPTVAAWSLFTASLMASGLLLWYFHYVLTAQGY